MESLIDCTTLHRYQCSER